MFANGPQCTKAGSPSRVCTKFGNNASLRRRAIEPAAPRSSAVTGFPVLDSAIIIRPKRARKSA